MGAPLVWKTPHAERQLSGSEEMGDVNSCLPLQLCPFHPWSLLFLRILRPCRGHVPMLPAAAQGRGWAEAGEEGRESGLGSSADKGEPHTSLGGRSRRAQSRESPCMTPTPGPNRTCPFLNTDTEVPKPKPNFIYTHPKTHDLGLGDRSQGRGG